MFDPSAGRCAVIGHRGSPKESPQNTLPSFARAAQVGADGVEFDVRATQDGVLVVHHDPNLRATCGVDADICDLTFDELRAFDAGSAFRTSDGDLWRQAAPVRVPSFEEALDLVAEAGMLANIEVKNLAHEPGFTGTPVVALAAGRLVIERGLGPQVVFSSFNLGDMAALKRVHPELRLAWLTLGGFSAIEALELVRRDGLDGLHPGHAALEGELAAEVIDLSRQGRPVWIAAWTVNDRLEMRRLADAGVHALITDEPAAAVDIVRGADSTSK